MRVCPSVGPTICLSVWNAFFKLGKIRYLAYYTDRKWTKVIKVIQMHPNNRRNNDNVHNRHNNHDPQRPQHNNEEKETHPFSPELVDTWYRSNASDVPRVGYPLYLISVKFLPLVLKLALSLFKQQIDNCLCPASILKVDPFSSFIVHSSFIPLACPWVGPHILTERRMDRQMER